jgi:hypothetical protein
MSILTPDIEGKLTQKSLRIQELDKSVTKAIIDGDVDRLGDILNEFLKLKKEVKETIADLPISTINNHLAVEILRKISLNFEFQCDKYIKKLWQMEGIIYDHANPFSDDEVDWIGQDIFYSWISHYDYVRGLVKINSLFLSISVSEHLEGYVGEARKCYALGQYLSVYALCRTILETSVRDIGQRKGLLPKNKGKVKNSVLRNWSEMKSRVVPSFLKEEASKIYDRTSGLIHGRKTVDEKNAYNMFKRTLEFIQRLYDYRFTSKRKF